jgi:signal transduction histidine kinase
MNEILRLIRLSLLLRLIPAILGSIGAVISGRVSGFGLLALVAYPSLVIFIIATVLARRPSVTARQTRVLLALTLLIYVGESVAMPLLASMAGTASFPQSGRAIAAEELQRASTSAAIPLFFALIPTVLGAWLEGRRGWWLWAGALIGLTTLAALSLRSILSDIALGAFGFVALGIVTLVVCYFVASLADQQRAEHAQLEAANRKLAEQAQMREQLATTREHVRLSRDLHDTVAHKLAALAVQMNAIDAVIANDSTPRDSVRNEVSRARALVKDGLDETRRAISGLHANLVEDLGLAGALQRLAETATQRGAFAVDFKHSGAEPALSPDTANALYFIVQEALNNIELHAQAQQAEITFDSGTPLLPVLTLSVHDDGVGFNPDQALDESARASRFGLTGMRERAELIGAHLRMDSREGAGTAITVTPRYA